MAFIIIDGIEFENVQLAVTDNEQNAGLMGVNTPTLMAFPYKKAGIHKFWMKETPLALDIIFCKANEVIYIGKGEPYNHKTLIGPEYPVDLVLEAPRGFVDFHNINVGSRLRMRYSKSELVNIMKNGSPKLENVHDKDQIK